MRVSDAGYSRDLRSFNLAMRMLSQEARTRTVSAWTGLSAERVRKLSKFQQRERPRKPLRRPPGPTPHRLAALLTSPGLRTEADTIAGVCQMLAWLTPVAVILVMVLGGMAMANRISWGWCIAAILGIAIAFGAPQIVTWVRGMFGV